MWLLGREGHSRSRGAVPGKTYPPYSARFLEFVEGGGFIDRAPSGVYRGSWREDERGVVVQHPVHGPQSYRLLDGALLRWTEDEEHGGFHVLSYMPDVPPQLDAVTALLKKSKAPAELIEKRGWLLRALFEGRLDLLALVLRYGGEFSRERLEHLNDCPPAVLPAMLDLLLSQIDALGQYPAYRAGPNLPTGNFVGYLAHHACDAVIERVRARPEGEALLTAALIALLSSGSFYVGDGLPALLAGVPSADLRDEQGVPLIVHAVLKGPTDWVRRLLEKASPAARLSQNALLAGEWGTLEFAAGLDAKEAATRAIAAIEERQISGGNAPWRAARIQAIRDSAALLP